MEDAEFIAMIQHALEVGRVDEQGLADFLSVSRPTIARWKVGKNLPYNALRPEIQKALSTLLKCD